MKLFFTFALGLFLMLESHAQLLINEVLYDPSNTALEGDANGDGVYDQVHDEFIEFVNTGTGDLNVSKFIIFDKVKSTGVKTRRHTIGDFRIPSNGALVIFGGGTAVGTFGGATVAIDSGTAGLSLGNTGEIIILEDSSGNVLDSIDTDALSNNPDESYTRNPDISGDFVQHGSVTPGKLFSPGTRINGDAFNTILSVSAINQKLQLILFPNPSSGKVRLSIQEADIESVQVLDVAGKAMKSPQIQNGMLDLGHLPNGLFQIRANTRNGQASGRILIAR